ncbi:ABC transporter permease [Micromonospora endophytica]|uniref:Peptide ABC transporter permease n=1 Tax=Micromonospora endophytica TaxID=515350 RepID=A0A2W2DSK5_9ACTN|nr:ABC transporter permease [Micromonospora endophytica]PZG00127.1 peptide ABC transporter permease [Micromonospora endophytica]RIW42260.1 ABC transporter permease [Micromonospora endophytica]BCJ61464.1 peptide ABC transporter permease [Micromonospora endophytica]
MSQDLTTAPQGAGPEPTVGLRRSGALRQALRRPAIIIAGGLFIVICVAASLGPFFAGDPNAFNALERLQAPSLAHPFGTDNLGRDIAVRVLFGGRASLLVGFAVGLVSVAVGSLIGIAAAMFRPVDLLLMRVVDGIMSFPIIVLALSMMAILGPGLQTVIISLSIVLVPSVARVVRGRALVVSQLPMIDAARMVGASRWRIMRTYVLAHCVTPVLVQAAIVFTTAVLIESALSFIGAGLPPDTPSWGASLAESRNYLQTAWWMWLFPGLALLATVLSANVVIDGVRDVLDPRSARR